MTTTTFDLRRPLGRLVLTGLAHVGRLSLLVAEMVRGLSEWRVWFPRTIIEAWNIGVGSLPIILLVAGFAGAVTALQTGYQFSGNIPYYVAGSLIVESVVLELGPVLTGLILAGRIGARYAAELGTMRVTEQIDALETLGRSPASHLVIPRVLAGLVMIPVLTVIANVTGIYSGWVAVQAVLPVTDYDFTYGARIFWRPFDAYYSVIKGFSFAVCITVTSCYFGFSTEQGAEGVGKATTSAVVASCVMILLLDTLLAKLLLH
ncbi:MAG: ABC transporter permease [Gemmatimonadetes bacterium]|nr:ABC transporter permease [Gemmatimonadota bacterium]MBP6669289.1 ABC transporter permease [Gemmatimonadales bacterium]MBK6781504.1 ABC transporter permease [Gemmatimonadota bacterium]MBK7349933.1 ABC transporter permease [Gemmatimonadota bacterium]MBK7715546.1 ABC transporter permease [Gemmatimonadota bacterium]